MIGYPGIAPLTVAVSGASPGILVTSGSGDTYGWWPTPLVVNGNDARNAANLMAANEALTDRTNFLGQHMIDWTRGGTWATWTPGVAWGGHLSIDHSPTADSATGLAARGGSVNGGGVNGLGGGGNAYGCKGQGTGSSPGCWGIGGATGPGGSFTGGATSGNGIEASAAAANGVGALLSGHGTGAGAHCVPGGTAGTPAITAHAGPVFVDTNLGAPGTAPGANMLWGEGVIKARGNVVVTAGPAVAISAGSLNASGVAFAEPTGGNFLAIEVTMPQAMASATDYEVHIAAVRIGADFYQPVAVIVDATHWKFYLPTTYGASFTPDFINTRVTTYRFLVLGNQ